MPGWANKRARAPHNAKGRNSTCLRLQVRYPREGVRIETEQKPPDARPAGPVARPSRHDEDTVAQPLSTKPASSTRLKSEPATRRATGAGAPSADCTIIASGVRERVRLGVEMFSSNRRSGARGSLMSEPGERPLLQKACRRCRCGTDVRGPWRVARCGRLPARRTAQRSRRAGAVALRQRCAIPHTAEASSPTSPDAARAATASHPRIGEEAGSANRERVSAIAPMPAPRTALGRCAPTTMPSRTARQPVWIREAQSAGRDPGGCDRYAFRTGACRYCRRRDPRQSPASTHRRTSARRCTHRRVELSGSRTIAHGKWAEEGRSNQPRCGPSRLRR